MTVYACLFTEAFGVALKNISRNADVIHACTCWHNFLFERNDSMTTGTVKWFNGQKGFGFIAPDDGGPDAFVHISAVERSGMSDLRDGQKVSYDLVADRKSGKMSAENLQDRA
ncbi:hypothetical protein PsB1_0576 [Candidatus Phycosocius spiralis]|uniref:CSD domain-containing protein n=2 Tax=Alphaproteobacteria TaxID=28211 RepID=A0ABQ4PTT2_9PROT|nr:hypothetical protein PsB1_0576 [Candidatus Phycosocius spiralis]